MKRRNTLITIEGVKELINEGRDFTCEYLLVGFTVDGKPRYQVFYLHGDERAHLIAAKVQAQGGSAPRVFNLWPGLVRHHQEYGDGRPLTVVVSKSLGESGIDGDGGHRGNKRDR